MQTSSAPTDNRSHGRIRLRHNGREVLTLELAELEADGSVKKTRSTTPLTVYRTITLGSQDDAKLEDNPEIAPDARIVSPEIEVTGRDFDRLMQQPGFAGMIQNRKISHWPVG